MSNIRLPTPMTNAVHLYACAHQNYKEASHAFADLAHQLERDAMTMALRLYAESDDTFAPETIECMARWRPRVEALLKGEPCST